MPPPGGIRKICVDRLPDFSVAGYRGENREGTEQPYGTYFEADHMNLQVRN